jgi:short-subunit dehydrogenase
MAKELVVITGASHGIGRAIALASAARRTVLPKWTSPTLPV